MTAELFFIRKCLLPKKKISLNEIRNIGWVEYRQATRYQLHLEEVNGLDPLKLFTITRHMMVHTINNHHLRKYYFIKETDLKYAAFNVVNGLGLRIL